MASWPTLKNPEVPETGPLPLPMSPVVGTSPTGTLAERDRDGDLPKVTLPDPAVCADWFRAPGASGMSGATPSPKAQLFPDEDSPPPIASPWSASIYSS